ncbi:uncharacterized protein C8Q71DRAFT_911902 [Rhodofomes roseus]|uniref:F-box domain-containing protein n=1 Tax=Rhodofomes roseus TaxID=34475 RepID=A0ABQ8JYT1_9APHY|nr:uncharacterized protein C8Q71DRAFT_911902 [Rhodofomes roseus]KAH9829358.1 hypothetical protein C8Q71DRAFT_911902 [Rhodofomes roseus]
MVNAGVQPGGHHGLNADIWSNILSFVSPSDARSLSLVSHTIHPAARRVVFSRAEISEQNQLEHAHAFMIGEPHHRACWLRELHIHYYAVAKVEDRPAGSALAAKLADLLEAARNISSLALPCMEPLLEADPRVGTALASLARLEVVRFADVRAQTLKLANTMASRPTQVTLVLGTPCDSEYIISEYLVSLSHLTLLRNASAVEIEFFELQPRDRCTQPADFDFELGQLGQHPTVRELRLRYSGPLPLFHIFPNMQVLRMRCLKEWFAEFDWREWAWTESVPLVDVTADNDKQLLCLAGERSQPTLRQLCLHQPPGSVTVDLDYDYDDEFEFDHLQPVCLTFPVEEWHAPENMDIVLWRGYLGTPAGPEGRLRYLQVTAQCESEEDMSVQWAKWLLPALRTSQLVCLRLNFDVSTPSGKVARLGAARLVRYVPSLRYLCIAEGQCVEDDVDYAYEQRFVGKCTWWRVYDAEGERRVESISCEAGERVEQYLRSQEFEKTLSLDAFVLDDA